MKNIYLFSFTQKATAISGKLYEHFHSIGANCTAYTLQKYCTDIHTPIAPSLQEQVKNCFHPDAAIIFVSACGIAVRAIAPHIKSKTSDPCVLVIDELGQYVISLLSGHIGGGNELALTVSDILHATPIISTATDLNKKFAVDVFAKKNKLIISDMFLAKKVSASLLHNIPIGICGNLPEEPLPAGFTTSPTEFGISISPFYNASSFSQTLYLIPRNMVLGVGCKKNTDPSSLSDFIHRQLKQLHIFPEAVAAITSIDIKKEEPAILALAKEYNVPFVTYSADTLKEVKGSQAVSNFVTSVTGVDNVCERATLAYTKADTLLLPKTIETGMTLAISELPLTLTFQTDEKN